MEVTYDDVARAHERIKAEAHRTPVLSSATVDALTGAKVFFKPENLQRMGAFKFRGAYNALSQLSADEKKRGVVAFSSGNHAQAVALAGKLLGVPRIIVMPADAPKVKVDATRGYGAEIVLYQENQNREELARNISSERGLTLIPPYDHPHVVAGQGTAAKELIEDAGPLDLLVVPVGGGGLIAGCATIAKALGVERVVGVEPEAGNDWQQSFAAGRRVAIDVPRTIADGLQTHTPGELTWAVASRLVDEIVTVTDAQIVDAMRFAFERLKLVIEPSGAVGIAALQCGAVSGARVGVVISGGNVSAERFAELLA